MQVEVEFIETVVLDLETGYKLVLENTLYVPSFIWNLISILVLHSFGYDFNSLNEKVNLLLNSRVVGHGILSDGLSKIFLTYDFEYNSFNSEIVGSKWLIFKKKLGILWHRHLDHISKDRVDRLIKSNILPPLDFGDIRTYIDCMRGMMT